MSNAELSHHKLQEEDLKAVMEEFEELGLIEKLMELELKGWTVLEPGVAAPIEFVERLRDRVLEVADERLVDFDPENGVIRGDKQGIKRTYANLFYLIFEGRIFEEVVFNPAAMAFVDYMCGQSSVLLSLNAQIKSAGSQWTPMHNDLSRMPAPLPVYSQMANATWCLTDYNREAGGLAMVPGSHRYCNHPRPDELDPDTNPDAVPVEAPFGSLIVWHSNTWHAGYRRTAPGIRMNLIMYYGRSYIQQAEVYWDKVTEEFLERNPDRMKTLLGLDARWPVHDLVDVDFRRISKRAEGSGRSLYS